MGQALYLKEKYEKSIEKYSKALEIDPDNVNVLNNRGLSQAALKNISLAFSDYNRALSINPNNSEVLHNRGNAYVLEENYDYAHRDFNTAI